MIEADCWACADLVSKRLRDAGDWAASLSFSMYLCPSCGNKRCPKATAHTNACTRSNETGQPGSRYPARDPYSSRFDWSELRADLGLEGKADV